MSRINRYFSLAVMVSAAGILLAGCPSPELRLEGKWTGTKTVGGVTCVFTVEFKDGQMIQTADGTGGTATVQTTVHEQIVFEITNISATSITLKQVSAEYTSELSGSGVTETMLNINEMAESAALAALESRNGTEITMVYAVAGGTLTLEGIALTKG